MGCKLIFDYEMQQFEPRERLEKMINVNFLSFHGSFVVNRLVMEYA